MNTAAVFRLSPRDITSLIPYWNTLTENPGALSNEKIEKFEALINSKLTERLGKNSVYLRSPATYRAKLLGPGWKDPHSGEIILTVSDTAAVIKFGVESDLPKQWLLANNRSVTIQSTPEVVQFLKEILMQ